MAGIKGFRKGQVYQRRNLTGGGGGGREAVDTSHILTQSELDERLQRNRTTAQNILRDFELPESEQKSVREIAIEGRRSALKGVGSIIETLDRPRKAVGLALRDVTGFDANRGASIDASHFAAVWAGRSHELVDELGEDVVGRGGTLGFSNLLDGVWESNEEDAWFDKAARGVVSFAGDVVTDPLTYVTTGSSAVGKTAAITSARQTFAKAGRSTVQRILADTFEEVGETALERGMREAITESAEGIYDDLIEKATRELVDGQTLSSTDLDDLFEEAVNRAAGFDTKLADDFGLSEAEHLSQGVVADAFNKRATAIEARDWGALDKDYIDHVFTTRGGQRLGDAFTTGGLRLGLPFSAKYTTRALPGTRGLSKRIPGVKAFRAWNNSSETAKHFKRLMPGVNAEAPLFLAAREGMANEVLWAQNIARAAKRTAGNAPDQHATLTAAKRLDEAIVGLSKEERDEVWSLVFPSMQVGRSAPDLGKFPPAVQAAVDEFVEASHGTIGRAYEFLQKVSGQEFGYIETHVPLMMEEGFARAVRRLREDGLPFDTVLASDLSKAAKKYGVTEEELGLWLEVYDRLGQGVGRKGTASSGTKAVIRERTTGRTLINPDDSGVGNLLFFHPSAAASVPAGGVTTRAVDRVAQQLAPEGEMTVRDLLQFAEIDVHRSMKNGRTGTENVEEIKASIRANGYDPNAGDTIHIAVDPKTDQVMLADGHHRLTALAELGEDWRRLPVTFEEYEDLADIPQLPDAHYLEPKYVRDEAAGVPLGESGWQSQAEINDVLKRVTSAIEEKESLNLGLKGSDALITDPVKLVGNYLQQVASLAEQRAMQRAFTHLGRIQRTASHTNLEGILFALGHENQGLIDKVTRIVEAKEENLQDVLTAEVKTKKVSIGNGRHIELPKEVADHPRMRRLVERLRKDNERLVRHQKDLAKVRRAEKRRLVEAGVDDETADMIVGATGNGLTGVKARIEAELEIIGTELEEAVTRAYFEGARQGIDADHAMAMARQWRLEVTGRARDELRAMQDAYDEMFPVDTIKAVDVADNFNYADPVQFAAGVQALLEPMAQLLQDVRQRNMDYILDTLNDLGVQRAKVFDELAGMSESTKNARTLDPSKAGFSQRRVTLEARLANLEQRISSLAQAGEMIEGSHTADDIHMSMIASAIANDLKNEATHELAQTWDAVLAAGVERALAKAEFADEKLARRILRETEALKSQWENYVEAVEAGTADLADEVFDSPWFLRTLAHGYLAQREAIDDQIDFTRAALMREGVDADELEETLELLTGHLRPALFDDIEADYVSYITRAEQLAARAGDDVNALKALGDMYEGLPGNRTAEALQAASKEERNGMAGEIVAFYGERLARLREGDEEMWINALGSMLEGYYKGHQKNLAARVSIATADEQFNGGIMAVDRAMSMLARAPFEPDAAEAMLDPLYGDLINDVFRRVYPDRTIRFEMADGQFRIRFQKLSPARSSGAPEPQALMDAFKQGAVSEAALREKDLGFIVDLARTSDSLEDARRAVLQGRYRQKVQLAAVKERITDFEDLQKVILEVRGGKQVRALRDWAFTGTATGRVVKTDKYRRLLRFLGTEEADRLERIVQRTLLVHGPEGPQAARLARLADETMWEQRLFEPIEKTLGKIKTLEDELRQAGFDAATEEFEQSMQLVQEFAEAVTVMNSLALQAGPDGLAPAGVRFTSAKIDDMTAAEVIDAVKRSAKALQGKAPDGLSKGEIRRFINSLDRAAQDVAGRPAGFVDAADYGLSGTLQGKSIDPVVGAIFRNMLAQQQAMFTPQGLSTMRKSMQEILRWWRGAATVARIPFHARNLVSAVANGMLISVGPQHYGQVLPDYVAYRKALRAGVADPLEAVSARNRRMFEAALHQEVIGSGFVRSELGVALGHNKKARFNPADANNFVLFGAGAEMMQSLEDTVRLAAFHRWFDDAVPETAGFARQMVMVAHFDYQHLGELEQKLKPIAPFFVWTRRNVPLQLRAIYESPAYIQAFGHLSRAMKDNFGERSDIYSPYAGSLAAPLGFGTTGDDENWQHWIFDPDLPISNLEDLPLFADRAEGQLLPIGGGALSPGAWAAWGLQLLSPQYSLLGEATYGEEYRTNAPTGLNGVFRLLDKVDFFNQIDISSAGDARISSTTSQLLNTAVPFAREWTSPFEANPNRAARLGFENDETGWSERLQALVQSQFAGGVGLERQTPTDAKGVAFDTSEFLKEITQREREQLPLP